MESVVWGEGSDCVARICLTQHALNNRNLSEDSTLTFLPLGMSKRRLG